MVLGASAAPLGGEPLPQAACVHWGALRAIETHGRIEADGLTGSTTTVFDPRSGRHRTVEDFAAKSQANGFDGIVAWGRDISGGAHAYDAAAARRIAFTEAWLRKRGWCGSGHATRLPAETNGSTTWQVTPPGGTPVILRFTPDGLLAQAELGLWEGRVIHHYENWRTAGAGVQFPYVLRDEYPEDESTETVTLDRVDFPAKEFDAATFRLPPAPTDALIAAPGGTTTVRYEDDGVGRIYVPVFLNGQGPFAFEIDTGGHFILSPATAAKVGLTPVGDASATGGGTAVVRTGFIRVQEIRIGDATIREQAGRVLPLSDAANYRGARPPRAGLLGLELFERFVVSLDRARKTLTLTMPETFHPPAKPFLPLRISFIEDAPLTAGSFNGVAGDFELDSGNAGPAIIEGYWAKTHGLDGALAQGLDWSGSGVGGSYSTRLSRGDLTIGGLALPHQVVSYVGLPETGSESTHLQAGVIGESTLYRYDMIYDYRRATVWIDPTPMPERPFNRSGLRLGKDGDAFTVAMVVPGSPAADAGLKAGDRIVALNGQSVAQMSTADAAPLLAGPPGSDLTVTLAKDKREVTLRLREILP
jgi:hypothetical protein